MLLHQVKCLKPWTDFGVWNINGNVRVCCWSNIVVGNINTNSIEEIWNGREYQALRNNMACGIYSCNPHCPVLHGSGFMSPYFSNRDKGYYEGGYSEISSKNAKLSVDEIQQRLTILASKPRYFKIYVDSVCNLRCSMCRLDKEGTISIPESFFEDLKSYYPFIEGVGVWGGEPLFSVKSRSLIFDFDYKQFPQCKISIITNGTLLSKYVSELEKVHLDWVQISLDAATKDTYKRIRTNGSWERTISGIGDLVQLRNRQENWYPITIDMVIQPENYTEVPAFIKLGNSLGTRVTFGNLDTTTNWMFDQPSLLKSVREYLTQGMRVAIQHDMLSASTNLSALLDLTC